MAKGISEVYIATCDLKIRAYIKTLGGHTIMTSPKHNRAASRVAEALKNITKTKKTYPDVVIMVQGDEPLVPPKALKKLLSEFRNPSVNIANIMCPLGTSTSFLNKNNVKLVFDCNRDALYFSREPIPSNWKKLKKSQRYMQTGIIAFRPKKLIEFLSLRETPLEKAESVDMNRMLS